MKTFEIIDNRTPLVHLLIVFGIFAQSKGRARLQLGSKCLDGPAVVQTWLNVCCLIWRFCA